MANFLSSKGVFRLLLMFRKKLRREGSANPQHFSASIIHNPNKIVNEIRYKNTCSILHPALGPISFLFQYDRCVFGQTSPVTAGRFNINLQRFGGTCMNCHANKSIECTVQQCANHCPDQNYCSLDCITVGTHELNPTVSECTDCKSFHRK